MENQFSASDLNVSSITALSNVKEVQYVKKSKINVFILIAMVVFTTFFVFLSVYKFDGTAKPQVIHAASSYNSQVQQIAK
jgi:hypothetical protein